MMAKVFVSLSLIRETWMEFLAPDFGLAQPQLLLLFWEYTGRQTISVSLSLSLSKKYIFKNIALTLNIKILLTAYCNQKKSEKCSQ